MNKVIALAGREIADRRMILLTAAVLAVLPFAALLIPEIERFGSGRVIATTAGATAAVYGFSLVFLLGGSFVVRELTDKRMSFYFSKPLAGPAIWFGKLAGTIATIFAALAIILIPSVAATGNRLLEKPEVIAWFMLALVTWFLVAHASSTMIRSRSPLPIVDVICLAIAGTATYQIVRTLEAGRAHLLIGGFLAAITAALLVILIAAGAWQVSRGRIDARRNHHELSRFLWSAIAVMLLIAGAILWWIVSVQPADLRTDQFGIDQPANGKWVRVMGAAKNRADYHAVFIVNVANGAYERVDTRTLWRDGFFTPDGKIAGQLRGTRDKRNLDLELVRFGERAFEVVPTKIELEANSTLMASDDATRLAVMNGDSIRVQSLPQGDVLAAARLPFRPRQVRYFFATPNVVRIYAQVLERVQVFELDVPAKKLTNTGSIGGRVFYNANADASRLFVRTIDGDAFIADARTGEQLALLGPENGGILQDGRIASVPTVDGDKAVTAGSMKVAIPHIRRVQMFRELSGNRLLVGGPSRGNSDWVIHVVDLTSGKVVRTTRNLTPLQHDFFNYLGRDVRNFAASAETPILMKRGSEIVRWTPSSGVIAGL